MDQWAYEHGVALHFIRPGKPTDNGHIESFNGKFRDECLNQFWFVNLVEARERIEAWRIDYNQVRPHSSLGYQTPEEFAAKMAAAQGCGKDVPRRQRSALRPGFNRETHIMIWTKNGEQVSLATSTLSETPNHSVAAPQLQAKFSPQMRCRIPAIAKNPFNASTRATRLVGRRKGLEPATSCVTGMLKP